MKRSPVLRTNKQKMNDIRTYKAVASLPLVAWAAVCSIAIAGMSNASQECTDATTALIVVITACICVTWIRIFTQGAISATIVVAIAAGVITVCIVSAAGGRCTERATLWTTDIGAWVAVSAVYVPFAVASSYAGMAIHTKKKHNVQVTPVEPMEEGRGNTIAVAVTATGSVTATSGGDEVKSADKQEAKPVEETVVRAWTETETTGEEIETGASKDTQE